MVSRQKGKSSGASASAASPADQLSPSGTTPRNVFRTEEGDLDDGSGSNPLKRRFDDGVVDYPRRRATIAVRKPIVIRRLNLANAIASARCAAHANRAATATGQNASYAPSLAPTVFIASRE